MITSPPCYAIKKQLRKPAPAVSSPVMEKEMYRNILVIADIEGSSGCFGYAASCFRDPAWPAACESMSRDLDAVARALFAAGAQRVVVKDFHRTAYNLLPELITPAARIVQGYRAGPVPGIGAPSGCDALMMIGMHAASGTGGFLAHTLTSRLAKLEVNGAPMPEAGLFAASLAPFGLRPVFFSGCPVACAQAASLLPGIAIHPIDKSAGPGAFDAAAWRRDLAAAAVASLTNRGTAPYDPPGPCSARIVARDGAAAAKRMAAPWGFRQEGDAIYLEAADLRELYRLLIRLCYFTPLTEAILPAALFLYDLYGRYGRHWVRGKNKSRSV